MGIAPLPRSDKQGQGAASALTGEVDLAGQAAPGASEPLVWAVRSQPEGAAEHRTDESLTHTA